MAQQVQTNMASASGVKEKSKPKSKKKDKEMIETIKHYDVFYGQAPPGLVQEEREKPEDCIPDLPQNRSARQFLSKAPTRGLWMPLGKEVKVMKCWRCKAYGHRTGDRECPLFLAGNASIEKFRYSHEDPMHNFISENKREEKQERIRQLQSLLDSSSSDSESSSTSSFEESKSKKRKRKKKDSKEKKREHKKSKKQRLDHKDH